MITLNRSVSSWSRPLSLLVLSLGLAVRGLATGFYGPGDYLGDGGLKVAGTPEFYWSDELERMAREFHPPEKHHFTTDADAYAAEDADYAAALKSGTLKATDPEQALKAHLAARALVDSVPVTPEAEPPPDDSAEEDRATLAAEAPSEFADYHRGAYFYRMRKWPEARAAWEALLARPPAERPYRSVWAAFMLGRLGLKTNDAAASAAFQKTRALAAEGFADPLGMAAGSYGWEARGEWKRGHPEKAVPLYLAQLATGDRSALVSLKALVPDRTPVEGMLNYGPEPEELEKLTDTEKKAAHQKTEQALEAAARDPWLRRLVTVHILATATYGDAAEGAQERGRHWLNVLERAPKGPVRDAEYLGWIAYQTGAFPAAARWLALAEKGSPAAAWLKAKLAWRAGRTAEAAESLQAAWQALRPPPPPAEKEGEKEEERNGEDKNGEEISFESGSDAPGSSFPERAGGDLAALHLARGDFLQALEIFQQADFQEDAAYVAERVLTLPELQGYVAQHPEVATPKPESTHTLSYLLGRRLVREGRLTEAVPLLPAGYGKLLVRYEEALRDGADPKRSKSERVEAWSLAAWLARRDGMELMGTEAAPDAFAEDGQTELEDVAAQRRTGRISTTVSVLRKTAAGDGYSTETKVRPIALKASAAEVKRLTTQPVVPDVRFHYRVIAAQHALEAAKLMPDQTPELADLLNVAGLWTKERDEKMADRIYAQIERRAGKTPIGKEVLDRHWFVETTGGWSDAQEAKRAKLMVETGLSTPDQGQ